MTKYNEIFRNVPNGPMAKNICVEFEQLEESLFSQYRMLNALASLTGRFGSPKQHEAFRSLALKMFEFWESITECAEEFDSMFPDKEA